MERVPSRQIIQLHHFPPPAIAGYPQPIAAPVPQRIDGLRTGIDGHALAQCPTPERDSRTRIAWAVDAVRERQIAKLRTKLNEQCSIAKMNCENVSVCQRTCRPVREVTSACLGLKPTDQIIQATTQPANRNEKPDTDGKGGVIRPPLRCAPATHALEHKANSKVSTMPRALFLIRPRGMRERHYTGSENVRVCVNPLR